MTPKEKLASIVKDGQKNMTAILGEIQNEFDRRKDFVVKPSGMKFHVAPERVSGSAIQVETKEGLVDLTPFSEDQLYKRMQIPAGYGKRLVDLGESDLLIRNLDRMNRKINPDGTMIRQVDGVARGLLSPSYRRMDASPIFQGFMEGTMASGYVPYRGLNTHSRYNLTMLSPHILEIAPNEVVVYGVSLTTSDYGAAALNMDLMALRIWCTNLAVGYDLFRKFHLGKRFQSGEEFVELSTKTQDLDTATISSAIMDVVKQSKEQITILHETIMEKAGDEVDVKKYIETLKKKGISKEVADKIQVLSDTDMPIEALPQVHNKWRLSNIMSLIAKDVNPKDDNKIFLEKEAMAVLIN
jgi:hypothetical protein